MNNNDLVVLKFNNIEIPISLKDGPDAIMVNVTPMAKAYNKRYIDWRRLPSTQPYLMSVLVILKVKFPHLSIDNLIVASRGRYTGGTWMHQLVLIEFSRWLDPQFAVWCNMMIIQLIRDRFSQEISNRDKIISDQNNKIQFLEATIANNQAQLNYANNVLTNSNLLFRSRDLIPGMSGFRLHEELIKLGVAYRLGANQDFYLKEPYNTRNYLIEKYVTDKNGNPRIIKRWTERGKFWVWSLLK